MKNHLLIKTMLLLCALVVGSSHSVWAVELLNEPFNISGTSAVASTYNGWDITRCYGGEGSIRVGATSGDKGQLISPALSKLYGSATLTFDVKRYGSDTGTISISIEEGSGSVSGDISVVSKDISADEWTTKTVVISEGAADTKIKFLMSSASSRMYLKNVRIVTKGLSWERTSKGIDELTYSFMDLQGETGTRSFSGKSGNSKAVYAGRAKKDDINYIYLTASDNNGIVSTTSGGKAKKIVVTWNSGTTVGRTLDVYGKNTTYSSAANLYDNEKKGTLIGSIVKGTSIELDIADDYEFIGIRSNGNSLMLDKVRIYWEGDAVSLSDASDYTPVAKDYAKVTLDRSFVAGWNGIVLPFDLTTSVKTALGATEVKTLDSATESAGAISLGFADAELPVAAGTPVLVKLPGAIASGDAVINGVEIKTTTPTTIEKTVAGNTFTLTGGYTSTNLEASEAYFVSNTKFYHKAAGSALTAKPFRAYITQTAAATSRMNVNFDLEGGETTGIIELQREGAANTRYYNLCGQQVIQPNKGLYIANGRKVIIK